MGDSNDDPTVEGDIRFDVPTLHNYGTMQVTSADDAMSFDRTVGSNPTCALNEPHLRAGSAMCDAGGHEQAKCFGRAVA